jgi:hypothetical protein
MHIAVRFTAPEGDETLKPCNLVQKIGTAVNFISSLGGSAFDSNPQCFQLGDQNISFFEFDYR